MTKHPMNIRSEKGVALIIVLLLLVVMSGLTTGLALNGQTESAMASNELNYAGARAAAEAGLNRAIEQITADTVTDLMATKTVPVIGNGPFDLTGDYSYSFELVDDDDPILYPTALTEDQLDTMGEDGDPDVDVNNRMILRSTGTGPRGTIVSLGRILSSTEIPDLPEEDTIITDPAILVNGDLSIAGNTQIEGTSGDVHANGDITGSGNSYEISGDLTASGDLIGDIHADGMTAGSMPAITVPEIKASDFLNLADYILTSTGQIKIASSGEVCTSGCPSGWSWSAADGTWSSSGSMPTTATYYVQGSVSMHGTGKSSLTKLSVIAEGSITLTGNGQFAPENGAGIQFVTNGDFTLAGSVDADDSGVNMDGQIMVREQVDISGNSQFQGRVMVENRDSDDNVYDAVTNPNGRRNASTLTGNGLSGNMTVTYNGGLDDITTVIEIPGGASTYTNNISGWIEQ